VSNRPPEPRPVLDFGAGMALLLFATVYFYHGRRPAFFDWGRLAGLDNQTIIAYGGFFQCAGALLLLLVPSILVARFMLDIPVRHLGLALGDWKYGLKAAGIAIVVLVPSILLTGHMTPGLCEVYPLTPLATTGMASLLAWEAAYLVYYLAWETTFRGVVQLGLGLKMGIIPAMLIQTALTTALHFGGPEAETLAALAAGPVLGYLAIRTGSILYPFAIHFAAGIATDIACGGYLQ
jgi:uncharacterized protein